MAEIGHDVLGVDRDFRKIEDSASAIQERTPWECMIRELHPLELLNLVREPRILDARNALALDRWRDAGWTVRSMGRRQPRPEPLHRLVDAFEQ